MRILRALAVTAAALTAFACASTSDLQTAQRQVNELQDELANVKRTAAGKEDVQNVNTRIAEQTETLLKSNATLVAKVNEIEDRIASTQGGIEQTGYKIEQITARLTQQAQMIEELRAKVAALTPPPSATTTNAAGEAMTEVNVAAPVVPAADPMQTYQAAIRDYQRGNYDLAIEGFRDFLTANANSDYSDNASYWIGESLYSQKKYREAIAQFDAVVNKFPKSDKVPGALLKKGLAYIALGERAQGIVQLQYVLHEHPNSQEASLARQRLKQLGIETK
jgi:tol-pal system protein YbgF